MNRLYTLDYLRGIAAFSIMLYHYLIWTTGKFGPDTIMGRLGIYGVSIFYILSGLTLYYVYYDKMKPTQPEIVAFVKKRIFRIFPLLWLVTISAILLSRKSPNFYDLFLNLSGLFGFVKWEIYFSAGVWSIGNELVFYFFFPFFILFAKSFRPYFILLSAVLFSLYLYFAFTKLNPQKTLSEQWIDYVNPLNQVFLFLGGFLIGLFFSNIKLRNSLIVALFFIGLGLFAFMPTHGETINLVTGYNRLIFTFSCLLICFCFYKLTIKFPSYIHKPLTLLGEVSYSIYLLHPIIYDVIGRLRNYTLDFSDTTRLILSMCITLIAAYFTYEYFEKFFMKFAKQRKE
jgi:exopolysaccharide production protein ExoZ